MLSFFRINDPYRLLGVFLVLILIRIPFLYNSDILIVPELKWMLLGEEISNGKLLYKEVWDTTGPLSGLFYALIHLIFGRSILVYKILALIIITIYAFIYSKLTIDNNLYLEKTYVPAIVFAILSSIFFDFYTLSPPLLGLLFIILCLAYLFKLVEKGLHDHQYYNVGFLVGIAGLFYLPYAVFVIFVILSLFLFSSTSLRKFLLMLSGFFFPYLILFIFYSMYDGLESLYYMYFISFLTIAKRFYVNLENQAVLIIVPLLFVILSFGKLLVGPRFVNYQQKTQRLMLLYLICSIVSFPLAIDLSPMYLIVFLPGFTFFITHYFLLIKRKFLAEIIFTLFVFAIPFINLGIYYKIFGENFSDYDRLIVKSNNSKIKNKRILVLGDNLSPYVNNSAATPYLDWSLSKNHFESLNYFEVVLAVNYNLSTDLPQVIIDESNSVKKLFERIPAIGKKYKSCGNNIYCLKVAN